MNRSPNCPCGSLRGYADCCGPIIAGEQVAATAEALMRSRFTAYREGNVEYVRRSWHSRTRPQSLKLEADVQWLSLEILETQAGGEGDDMGEVEFVAHCRVAGTANSLHERSQFLRESLDGAAPEWRYVDGETPSTLQRPQQKTGRNAPCPCGSGKKFKRCCGR